MADFSGDGSSRGSVSCFRDAALFNATLLRCETFWEPYSGPTESPRRETLRRRCIASQGSLIMGTYIADFFLATGAVAPVSPVSGTLRYSMLRS